MKHDKPFEIDNDAKTITFFRMLKPAAHHNHMVKLLKARHPDFKVLYQLDK
jgi:hypothetical protein